MAKVSFNSLITTKTIADKVIECSGKPVNIKQYLSISAKADMIDAIVQKVFDQDGLVSPLRQDIYFALEVLRWYTNINITETMMRDIEKTYDLLILNHIIDIVFSNIPETELSYIRKTLDAAILAISNYTNSFAGQIKTVAQDYGNVNLDMDNMVKTLSNSEQLGFLKELMAKMG